MATGVGFSFNDILNSLGHIKDGIPMLRPSNRIIPGLHKSIFFGPSCDIYDIREYDKDRDPPNLIIYSMYDPNEGIVWAMKTREEHGAVVHILADLSDSTINSGTELIKRRMLLEAVGFIGLSGSRYMDRVALTGFTDRIALRIPGRSGVLNAIHLLRILYDCLERDLPKENREPRKTNFITALDFIRRNLHKRCFIPIISDFIGFEEAMQSIRFMKLLKNVADKHEVVLIFLDDPEEILKSVGTGYLRETDIETGKQTVTPRSRKKREKMAQEIRVARDVLRKVKLKQLRIGSVVLEPGKQIYRLQKFFMKRNRIKYSPTSH